MADKLASLPVDGTPLNHNEISLMNQLFENKNSQVINQALAGVKDILLASIVFFAVSLPFLDEIIKRIFPSTGNSLYIMALVKTVIFAIIFFALNNFYLARKN
jgi:hypothetical protein